MACHFAYIYVNWDANTHLMSGTGNAWAWHNNPKLWPTCLTNVKLFDSAENVGAFDPTGSAWFYLYNNMEIAYRYLIYYIRHTYCHQYHYLWYIAIAGESTQKSMYIADTKLCIAPTFNETQIRHKFPFKLSVEIAWCLTQIFVFSCYFPDNKI